MNGTGLSCSGQSRLGHHRPFAPCCANRDHYDQGKVSRQLTCRRTVRYSSPADERTKGTTGMKLQGQVAVITGGGKKYRQGHGEVIRGRGRQGRGYRNERGAWPGGGR